MKEKHFFVVHSYIDDEAKKNSLTPPEKRDPPQKWETEYDWAEKTSKLKYAQCMQTWCGNEEFFYCHWVAKSEQDVYRQLEESNLEGKIVNSMVQEAHQFVSAYRNSKEILRQYPEDGDKW